MKTIFSVILVFVSSCVFSQKTQLKSASKKFDNFAYVDAIDIYKKVADKGYESEELFKKIANAYYFNSEYKAAEEWYGKLIKLNSEVETEYYFRYAQCLKANEKYDEANKNLETFYTKSGDSRALLFKENKKYLDDIEKESGKFSIGKTTINSEYSDYGTAFFGDKIVYASARKEGALFSTIQEWTGQNYTDLYAVTLNKDGSLGDPVNFSSTINTKVNEATSAFTKDGKTMYFTRNNYLNGKKGKDKTKTTLVKIYKADFVDGEWSNIIEMPFNSDNYNTAHPTLSPDEKYLYFASDMPGSYGNSDIYRVKIENDFYGTPENLGKVINTEGKETYPFIAYDNTLYFSSDGQLGLGGLDVFESKYENGQYNTPVNVGKPINSSMDDFAFIMNEQKNGFFSSNRDNGSGYDDIYSLKGCSQKIFGTITDVDTKEILPNTRVELFDENMKKISETTSSVNSYYSFMVDCNTKYYVRASKEEFDTNEKSITTSKENGENQLNIELKRNKLPIKEGIDIAELLDIKYIYFDLDKSDIRPDAAKDIQKVIEVMKEYPTISIDIRSHTDSRASKEYNEKLSDRRAKSTLEFMVQNGISRNRLSAKGYGESQLVNLCFDGVACSEAEHQKNRRSEFIVIKMD